MPLPERTPSISTLDLFLSVVDLGSISRAAKAHGLSQPAASAAMAKLERGVGAVLLRRTTSGCEVTSAGERVAELASNVVNAAAGLNRELELLGDDAQQSLSIAASYTVAEYLLPAWLIAFRRSSASVAVQVAVENSKDVSAAVRSGSADIGFVEGLTVEPGLVGRTVYRDELVVVVQPDHPWARDGRKLSVQQLAAARLVVREGGSGTREVLEALLEPHLVGPAPKPLTTLGSTTAVKAAVRGGAGPAVVSRLAVQQELDGGQLCEVPIEGVRLTRALRAVWLRGHQLEPAAAQLLQSVGAPGTTDGLD